LPLVVTASVADLAMRFGVTCRLRLAAMVLLGTGVTSAGRFKSPTFFPVDCRRVGECKTFMKREATDAQCAVVSTCQETKTQVRQEAFVRAHVHCYSFVRFLHTSWSLLLLLILFGEVPGLTVLLGSSISVDFGTEAIVISLFSSPTISVKGFGLFMALMAVGYQSIVTLAQHKRTNTRYKGEVEGIVTRESKGVYALCLSSTPWRHKCDAWSVPHWKSSFVLVFQKRDLWTTFGTQF
jgi:hypothetical protein